MSDEHLFPRAVAEAAYRHVVKSNRRIERLWTLEATDPELENDLLELVASYDRPG